MAKIFVSYRHAENKAMAERIADRLMAEFRRENLFLDSESLLPGTDFAREIPQVIEVCDVLVVIIGRGWHLREKDDWVEQELGAAMANKLRVIPLLIDGAPMPSKDAMPPPLRQITTIKAVEVGYNPWFDFNIEILLRSIREELASRGHLDLAGMSGGVVFNAERKLLGDWARNRPVSTTYPNRSLDTAALLAVASRIEKTTPYRLQRLIRLYDGEPVEDIEENERRRTLAGRFKECSRGISTQRMLEILTRASRVWPRATSVTEWMVLNLAAEASANDEAQISQEVLRFTASQQRESAQGLVMRHAGTTLRAVAKQKVDEFARDPKSAWPDKWPNPAHGHGDFAARACVARANQVWSRLVCRELESIFKDREEIMRRAIRHHRGSGTSVIAEMGRRGRLNALFAVELFIESLDLSVERAFDRPWQPPPLLAERAEQMTTIVERLESNTEQWPFSSRDEEVFSRTGSTIQASAGDEFVDTTLRRSLIRLASETLGDARGWCATGDGEGPLPQLEALFVASGGRLEDLSDEHARSWLRLTLKRLAAAQRAVRTDTLARELTECVQGLTNDLGSEAYALDLLRCAADDECAKYPEHIYPLDSVTGVLATGELVAQFARPPP